MREIVAIRFDQRQRRHCQQGTSTKQQQKLEKKKNET